MVMGSDSASDSLAILALDKFNTYFDGLASWQLQRKWNWLGVALQNDDCLTESLLLTCGSRLAAFRKLPNELIASTNC